MLGEDQGQYQAFRDNIDMGQFSTQPYSRKIDKPWGFEIHFTPDNLPYMGKVLHIDEGKRLSLQAHDVERESWLLASGAITLMIENAEGEMTEVDLQVGQGFTCAPGQKHRLIGGVAEAKYSKSQHLNREIHIV